MLTQWQTDGIHNLSLFHKADKSAGVHVHCARVMLCENSQSSRWQHIMIWSDLVQICKTWCAARAHPGDTHGRPSTGNYSTGTVQSECACLCARVCGEKNSNWQNGGRGRKWRWSMHRDRAQLLSQFLFLQYLDSYCFLYFKNTFFTHLGYFPVFYAVTGWKKECSCHLKKKVEKSLEMKHIFKQKVEIRSYLGGAFSHTRSPGEQRGHLLLMWLRGHRQEKPTKSIYMSCS